MRRALAAVVASAWLIAAGAHAADDPLGGKATYDSGCVACHGSGALGAPKLGDVAAWRPRIATPPTWWAMVSTALRNWWQRSIWIHAAAPAMRPR